MNLQPDTLLRNGGYRIIRTLGQGGFGITYEARQLLLNKKVAIKEFFMKDCCERDEATGFVTVGTGAQRDLVLKFRGKFIREAQMIAAMDHPNIVRVLDVFEENGTAYYVMESLPGGSLADKVKMEGPLSESLSGTYIRQVASALEYIHARGTVHLDVKPANILLNDKGEAVLIDFGISKHYDKSGDQTSSTPVGISKGYAPLEQGRDGDVSQFTPATDIYALGATLYYLVTGHVPPEASIVNEDGLARPKGVSAHIWKAIETAMQPRRKDRPQNVAAFLGILLDSSFSSEVENPVEDSEETIIGPVFVPNKKSFTKSYAESVQRPRFKRVLWLMGGIIGVVLIVLVIVLSKSEKTAGLSEPTGYENGYGYVDLGLSVKWAVENVGASSPYGYGDYYAWGETIAKNEYYWSNYAFRINGDSYDNITFSKYNNSSKNSGDGNADYKTVLDLEDDVASVLFGGRWRMPTEDEWTELRTKCTWTWLSLNEVDGYRVSGPNGNSIFLPSARYRNGSHIAGSGGYYWSSSLSGGSQACYLGFSRNGVHAFSCIRRYGLSVRPVLADVEEALEVNELDLNVSELSLTEGDVETLMVTYTPSDAKDKSTIWESSNLAVATVDPYGRITAKKPGKATILAKSNGASATCVVTVSKKADQTTGISNGHEWVDLGLSVKWAATNVGATSPGDYGDYYAWGETSPKKHYSWNTLKYCMDTTGDAFSKYVPRDRPEYWGLSGSPDNKTSLDPSDDAAHQNWGGDWRMPTFKEWGELEKSCDWIWTSRNGHRGCLVTSKTNGNSIFLPAAGGRHEGALDQDGSSGYYWSSSLDTEAPCWGVYGLFVSATFTSEDVEGFLNYSRCHGFSVRPVLE